MSLREGPKLPTSFMDKFESKFGEFALSKIRKENQTLIASIMQISPAAASKQQVLHAKHIHYLSEYPRSNCHTVVIATRNQKQQPAAARIMTFNNTARIEAQNTDRLNPIQSSKNMPHQPSKLNEREQSNGKRVNQLQKKRKIHLSLLKSSKKIAQQIEVDPKMDIFFKMAKTQTPSKRQGVRNNIHKTQSVVKRQDRGRSMQILKQVAAQCRDDNVLTRGPSNKLIYAFQVGRVSLE